MSTFLEHVIFSEKQCHSLPLACPQESGNISTEWYDSLRVLLTTNATARAAISLSSTRLCSSLEFSVTHANASSLSCNLFTDLDVALVPL